jgi:predicted N-acetyltransferase YhbS
MTVEIRRATPADAAACGPILFSAFKSLADHHHFPPDFASLEEATGVVSLLLRHPKFHGVVAEDGGTAVGSNFVDLRSCIAGIGPVSVDPIVQNRGIGRRLMAAVIDEAAKRNCPGVRLVQVAYHNRSLCLYTTMGFRCRGALSVLQGEPPKIRFDGYDVRPMGAIDESRCNELCFAVHGMRRGEEVREAVEHGTGMVIEHLGRIAGYTTGVGFFTHTVAESNRDLIALIASSPHYSGPGFLLPTASHEVLEWCLRNGLRLMVQATLMSIGLYNEPQGAWLPSVLY